MAQKLIRCFIWTGKFNYCASTVVTVTRPRSQHSMTLIDDASEAPPTPSLRSGLDPVAIWLVYKELLGGASTLVGLVLDQKVIAALL